MFLPINERKWNQDVLQHIAIVSLLIGAHGLRRDRESKVVTDFLRKDDLLRDRAWPHFKSHYIYRPNVNKYLFLQNT